MPLIIITILIILQLSGLLFLALYSNAHPTWTRWLDSFALLRLGAARKDDLPLISAMDAKELAVLDEKAGWISEANEDSNLGQLEIGGGGYIRKGVEYQSVETGGTTRLRKLY